ncbi:MAG TPA: site-specific integrase [Candidatus Acidoferrales bacterium]|nr:site-specific integrase [Candidatus Acidoferrales bacterium]
MARRHYQTGSIFVRGTKRKVYVLRYYERVLLPNGRVGKTRKSVVLGPVSEIGTKKQVMMTAESCLRQVNDGQYRPQSIMTFDQFVRERWIPAAMPLLDPETLRLNEVAVAQLGSRERPGSVATYGSKLRTHLIPAFGGKRLNEITRWDIQNFLTDQARHGYSGAHVHGMKTTLSKVMQTAVEWRFINENPTRGCRVARQALAKQRIFLDVQQIQKLCNALSEPCRSIVLVAVLTGLRIGEILALRWGRVDLLHNIIRVEESYSGRFGPPKTRSSRRTVPISSPLRALLQTQQARCKSTAERDLVFATHKGTPLSPKNLRNRALEPTRKTLGLPKISWHTFRYTHATWLSEAQVPARIAQSILGHSDVSMTLNVYTQVVPESQRVALEKIGAVLDSNGPKSGPNENNDSIRVN